MSSPVTFGEWLRQSRNQLRLTRKELAGHVGCSVSTLRKIESGERLPSIQIAELLANSLGIPTSERPVFVKTARGELSLDRLLSGLKPVTGMPTPPTNLPVSITPLVGRQQEIEQLNKLLRDPHCRLLTLVGPGGIGKTRLAVETAAKMLDAFADGVYFVPLAPVNRTNFIVPVIADAIGFVFQSQGRLDPKTQLFSYLREKQILLLADNLEHLLAKPGIEVLAELLENSLQVKLLATSRESLGLLSEWTFEVQGLSVPESRYAQGSTQNTSVGLFLQCAGRARVGFNATPEDYPAIVRICRLVEGNPLGIQLAAAWARSLSYSEIAQEIEHGLDFLSTSLRDIPARHRSIRVVFNHSWKLLSSEEQESLVRLSVFQGGFDRQAAEQVAGITLSMLSTLLAKSLIQRSGVGRYDVHGLIRQFVSERLAEKPEEQTNIEARHGGYYLALFSQADGRLRGPAQGKTLTGLTTEMNNFRTAWNWAITWDEFPLIEQTLRTFAMLHDTLGWTQAGLELLSLALVPLETLNAQSLLDRPSRIALGHLLASHALLASRLGEYEQAQTMLERSLEILRPLNEPRVLVETITFLGMVMESIGNYTRASELYSEGLEIARKIDDRWFAALCFTGHTALTGFSHRVVEPETTYQGFQKAVAEWRLIGDPRMTAIALNNLSLSAKILGRLDEAFTALEESISLSKSVGDRWGLGFAYRGLALIAQEKGQYLEAVDWFHKSLEIFSELGARQDGARILAEMGHSLFELGLDAEARRAWLDSLRLGTETNGTFIVLEALVGIARLQAKRGDTACAFELLSYVLDHPSSIQDTKYRAARLNAELEPRLTPQQIETARERVKAKTIEVIVDEVLK